MGFTVVISNTKHLIKHHTFLKISLRHRKSHVVKLDHNSDAIIRFNLQDCHFINIDRRNFYFLGNTLQSLDVRFLASHKRTFQGHLKQIRLLLLFSKCWASYVTNNKMRTS